MRSTASLAHVTTVYDEITKYSGYKMLISDDYNKWPKVFYRWIYMSVSIAFTAAYSFSVFFLTEGTESNFIAPAMGMGLAIHSICVPLRVFTVNHFKNVLTRSIFIDFEGIEANRHRPSAATARLLKIRGHMIRMSWYVKVFIASNVVIWYMLPILVELLKLMVRNQEITLDHIQLPSSIPTVQGVVPYATVKYFCEVTFGINFIFAYGTLDVLLCTICFMIREQYSILEATLSPLKTPAPGDNSQPLPFKSFMKDHILLLRSSRDLRTLLVAIVGFQLIQALVDVGWVTIAIITPSDQVPTELVPFLVFYTKLIGYQAMNLGELYIFCWFSHMINEGNERLGFSIYSSPWYKGNLKAAKDWLMPITMCQRPIEFLAFGMVPINMETFLSVVRMSYSYCMLMIPEA